MGGLGNLGRNTLRNESQNRVDVALSKQTQLSETTSMELRWEAFNILNNVNFGSPGNDLQDTTEAVRPALRVLVARRNSPAIHATSQ